MGNYPCPGRRTLALLVIGSLLIAGALLPSACGKSASTINLVEVEVLPELCLPVPRGFRRKEGYRVVHPAKYVVFSHWGWRYPEYIGVSQVEEESQASELIRSQIEMHCNCDWHGEIPELADSTHTIRFADSYAGSDAKIIATLKTIDGQEYLVWAYCLTVRDYCSSFLHTVSELRPCSEITGYLNVSESLIIPTATGVNIIQRESGVPLSPATTPSAGSEGENRAGRDE